MKRRSAVALAAAGFALFATDAQAAPAPNVGLGSLAQLPTPLPYPYDFTADGAADVAKARDSARTQGKLLLIDLGGNWCADCRILESVMRLAPVAAFVDTHYVVVHVDAGRINKNLDIAYRYGVSRVTAVPTVLIIDTKGRLVNRGHEQALSDARSLTPQAIADWIARWTP